MLQLENKVLRTQINPHVLYNTLNFLYAKSLPVSEELSQGILTLSEIMQYSLKNQESNGLVPLSDELDHINNILELARLKSDNKIHLRIQIEEFDENAMVIPLVMITLVENIFKHGDVSDPAHPALISIKPESENMMRFIVANKPRKSKNTEPSSNLGLSNARVRLEKEYGDQAEMQITQSETLFQVDVKMPIRVRCNSKEDKLVA